MRIATFPTRRWAEAVRAAGHELVLLPPLPQQEVFRASLAERIAHGRRVRNLLHERPVDLLLDAFGDGLLFVDDPHRHGMSVLLHHDLGIPLVSHWTETLRVLFKGLEPCLLHEALRSPTWFKAVFTRGHLDEMTWMGIPGCFYLPLAEDDVPHPPFAPLTGSGGPAVFFAGRQHSRYFAHADGVDTRTQRAGALAVAAVTDGSCDTFLDTCRRYEFVPPPADAPDARERARRVGAYYAAKMFYVGWRNVAFRDRFLLRLQRDLGDDCLLIGDDRWRDIYRLNVQPPVDWATYLERVRTTPVSVNLPNGDNETGLNLRHFEITAAGGFLLSYATPELGACFEIGRECDSFRNETELLEKVRYYAAHSAQRNAIARAGQQRTLREHLLHHRLNTVLEHLSTTGALRPPAVSGCIPL